MIEVAKGLAKSQGLLVGGGYLDLSIGVGSIGGFFARGEVGIRPIDQLSIFGYGKASGGEIEGGAGLRLSW